MDFRLPYFVFCVLYFRISSGQRLVSRGKQMTSSSQHSSWSADKAVDGNTKRAPNDCDCCAATQATREPWFKLDLGQQYKIYSISVLGRGGPEDGGGGYGHTLLNMEIKLGTTESNQRNLTTNTADVYVYNYTLPTPQEGRYLTLTLRNMTQYFVICELSVYAECNDGKYCTNCNDKYEAHSNRAMENVQTVLLGMKYCKECVDGKYGSECNRTCGKCKNSAACDKENGECADCITGIISTECVDSKYGPDCGSTCGKCKNSAPCDKENGRCPNCIFGYNPPYCKECVDSKYGPDCGSTCGKCKNNAPCDKENGRCPNCISGYNPPYCKECVDSKYGPDCGSTCGKCKNNAPCDKENGRCPNCISGYNPPYCKDCADYYFGNDCRHRCHCRGGPCNTATGICPPGGCTEGYNGDNCNTPCEYGKYGPNCQEDCGSCKDNATCDNVNGSCQACGPGYRGDKCKQKCENGTYGQGCKDRCGKCYDNEVCDHIDGRCTSCAAGYRGAQCKIVCMEGQFGINCSKKCGNCSNKNNCNNVNGSCPAGCDPGFKGDLCKAECDQGTFGWNCSQICGHCSKKNDCNKVNGSCPAGCEPGFKDDLCNAECEDGKFGENCILPCGNCRNGTICSRFDGSCDMGCELGYRPPLCQQECENGTFGFECTEECGNCLDGEACDKRNGTCLECEPGYKDPLCKVLRQVITPPDSSPPTGPIIGAVVGVVVLAVVVVFAVFLYRRRQNDNNAKPAKTTIPSFGDTHEYQSNGIPLAQKAPPKAAIQVKEEQPPTSKTPEELKNKDEENIYYAFLSKKTDLKICQLWDYIHLKKRDGNLLFYQEYNRLPGELKHPCDEAKKAKNAGKNRYKGLYAYDHTRVPLTVEGAGEGNYINASFIHGYEKQRKFIASQGPTENMRTDFWRMVWQQKSKTIVMLTNLTELGTEKCILYWPDDGDVTYGNITIRHVSEEVTTDFTIRQFEIFKDNANNRLPVTQYHFQAWPDKSTPDSTWSLVKFWVRVMQDTANMEDTGPIVVHCSAGIGRTGTFIALDTAYNQAKIEGAVRIFDVVTTIREQRVKMIQTRDQYVYLHEVVADALLFGTHFVWSGQFEEFYKYLADIPSESCITRLQTQFNLIVESVQDKNTVHTTWEDTDSEYSNVFVHGKHQQPVSIDDYRPKSKSKKYVSEVGALILQNHEGKGAFIICKSPTENYMADFWYLVKEQNVKTIVSLSPSKDSLLGLGNKMIQTKFGLSLAEERKTKLFTESKISLSDEISVTHFQYKMWSSGGNVPNDASSMVQFVEAVLDCQRRLSDTEPVLVNCDDGVRQSGVLCVLLSEINRLNRDGGHINIIQTVKMMKERNIDIIANFEQYRYIYDVIRARVKDSTYQNQ